MTTNIVWIAVTCRSEPEAIRIGKGLLAKRLIACYDVVPRSTSEYFWPPKSGKTEHASGALLLCTTISEKFPEMEKVIPSMHADDVPFIAEIPFSRVSAEYASWLMKEVP